MSDFAYRDDEDFEVREPGQAPSGSSPSVERFLRDFEEAFPETPTESLEDAHLAAMMRTAQLLAEKGDPVERPASNANGPAEQASGLPKLRRSTVFQRMFAPLYMKIGAGVAGALLAFSGVAFAGALPAPIQDAVAGVVAPVGISLPTSTDAAPVALPTEASDEATDAPAVAPRTEASDETTTEPAEQPAAEPDHQGDQPGDTVEQPDQESASDAESNDSQRQSSPSASDSSGDTQEPPSASSDSADHGDSAPSIEPQSSGGGDSSYGPSTQPQGDSVSND